MGKNTETIGHRAYMSLLEVYVKEIRPFLELAVPTWHSGLTQKQSADIECVQRVAVRNILSDGRTGKCLMIWD